MAHSPWWYGHDCRQVLGSQPQSCAALYHGRCSRAHSFNQSYPGQLKLHEVVAAGTDTWTQQYLTSQGSMLVFLSFHP